MAELEYISQHEGTEIDAAVGFGKSPDVRPTEGSEGGAESGGIYTFTQEQINANKVNRNLLDNPYFKIDQRQGYVAPPSKNYYSDTALTTLVGQTSEYVTVTAKASGYNTINISGTDYYVAVADCVRGYIATAGNTYTDDRWVVWAGGSAKVLILNNSDGSITIRRIGGTPQTNDGSFSVYQISPLEETTNARGKTVTISANCDLGNLAFQHDIPSSGNTNSGYKRISGYWYMQFSIDNDKMGTSFVGYYVPLNDEITVYGTKLEHGSISTLQAEMDSGNYDEDLDLISCQEYQWGNLDSSNIAHIPIIGTAAYSGTYLGFENFLFPTTMRIKPTVSSIEVMNQNGVATTCTVTQTQSTRDGIRHLAVTPSLTDGMKYNVRLLADANL